MTVEPRRKLKHSVSPFGTAPQETPRPFSVLEEAYQAAFPMGTRELGKKIELQSILDAPLIPLLIKKIAKAAGSDAPELPLLCQFLVRHKVELESKELFDLTYHAMLELFDLKTSLFLLTHYDKEACEKAGWPEESRDVALFALERDVMIAHFFGPITEAQPGVFAEFVKRWKESGDPDRLLHLLDFLAGSKDPTLDHYLLFTHPSLQGILRDRSQLRSLFAKVAPAMKGSVASYPKWAVLRADS